LYPVAIELKYYNISVSKMSNYIYKYKKRFSYLLLLVYLFVVALSVFHYHQIDIRNGDFQVSGSQDKNNSVPIDALAGLDAECIVTHFISTISSVNYFPEISYTGSDNQVFTSLEHPDKLCYVVSFGNNPLRAPPAVLPS